MDSDIPSCRFFVREKGGMVLFSRKLKEMIVEPSSFRIAHHHTDGTTHQIASLKQALLAREDDLVLTFEKRSQIVLQSRDRKTLFTEIFRAFNSASQSKYFMLSLQGLMYNPYIEPHWQPTQLLFGALIKTRDTQSRETVDLCSLLDVTSITAVDPSEQFEFGGLLIETTTDLHLFIVTDRREFEQRVRIFITSFFRGMAGAPQCLVECLNGPHLSMQEAINSVDKRTVFENYQILSCFPVTKLRNDWQRYLFTTTTTPSAPSTSSMMASNSSASTSGNASSGVGGGVGPSSVSNSIGGGVSQVGSGIGGVGASGSGSGVVASAVGIATESQSTATPSFVSSLVSFPNMSLLFTPHFIVEVFVRLPFGIICDLRLPLFVLLSCAEGVCFADSLLVILCCFLILSPFALLITSIAHIMPIRIKQTNQNPFFVFVESF